MLGTIIKFNISVRLTPQVTTIICHHVKKVLLKEKRNEIPVVMGRLDTTKKNGFNGSYLAEVDITTRN